MQSVSKNVAFHNVGSKESRRRKNQSRSASRSTSRTNSPVGRRHLPVSVAEQTNPFEDKEIVDMIRRVIETKKEDPSTADRGIAPATPPATTSTQHPFLDETTADFIRKLVVTMMEEKHNSTEKKKIDPMDEFMDLETRHTVFHMVLIPPKCSNTRRGVLKWHIGGKSCNYKNEN